MFGFNVNKLKPNLKMAVHRIGIVKNRKSISLKAARQEVAKLLAEGKEEKARIRVEGIIREDFTIEAYEIIELLCDLISERCSLIKSEKECPYDMREAVCTLIWAASRTEIPELTEVKKQLTKKYGQDFSAAAIRNADGCINERVVHKLSVQPPNAFLVVSYMKEIAKQHNVDWEPDETEVVDPLAPMAAPTGSSVGHAAASGADFAKIYASAPPPPGKIPSVLPAVPSFAPGSMPSPSNSTVSGVSSLPAPPTRSASNSSASLPGESDTQSQISQSNADEDVPDFDELSARFAKLRKRTEE